MRVLARDGNADGHFQLLDGSGDGLHITIVARGIIYPFHTSIDSVWQVPLDVGLGCDGRGIGELMAGVCKNESLADLLGNDTGTLRMWDCTSSSDLYL